MAVTDEEYWQVMTSLGFDKQKYSLRDDSDEVDDATHVTRRRAVVVSSPGFLAELCEQRAEAERKVAAIAAAKVASAAKREADQLNKAANAKARAEKKLQQVWVAAHCMGLWVGESRSISLSCFPSFGASDSGGGGGGEGGGSGRREATSSQQEAQNNSESVALRQLVLQGKGR